MILRLDSESRTIVLVIVEASTVPEAATVPLSGNSQKIAAATKPKFCRQAEKTPSQRGSRQRNSLALHES